MDCDVLIVGAGPTGLVLALWLTRLEVKVRIIDKTAAPGTTSRALAVQARTLELYGQLGLSDVVVERGHKVPAVNLWVKGEPAARLPFETIGADLTPYPFLHIFPQDQHERLLIERLTALGVSVERHTELSGFAEEGETIAARLRGADGREETCRARYIAGCDGASSRVRETMATGFPGGTYRQVFYVADVDADGPALDGELHLDLDEADFLAVFPLAGRGRARLIGSVRDARADRAESLEFADVSDRAINHLKVRVNKVNWFSTYRVHHRVAEHFRKSRAFLLGDAAHIHSPAGGQGMNTGIGDAINLAWKISAVCAGRATDKLLDSYEIERIGFARKLRCDDRPRLQLRHRRGANFGSGANADCTGRHLEAHPFRSGSRIHFPHRFPDHSELSRGPACGRSRGERSRWRPPAVGIDRRQRQFLGARIDGLASSRIRRSQQRTRRLVRCARRAAAHFRLASGT